MGQVDRIAKFKPGDARGEIAGTRAVRDNRCRFYRDRLFAGDARAAQRLIVAERDRLAYADTSEFRERVLID